MILPAEDFGLLTAGVFELFTAEDFELIPAGFETYPSNR